MKEKIKAYARSLGAAACGVAPGKTENESVIVCLFPYYHEGRGNISMHATGRDYHKVVSEKLSRLAGFLHTLFPESRVTVQVDIGEPVDKTYAQKSGVGFYGKNSLVINDICGSYAFIGFCKLNRPLPPDAPDTRTCARCDACVRACPGGAISPEGGIDPAKCASAISQKKGDLSPEEIAILQKSRMVWGCDRCQSVCPHNQAVAPSIPELRVHELLNLSSAELKNLSNREFKEIYGDYSFSWRGKSVLLRNCKLLEEIEQNTSEALKD